MDKINYTVWHIAHDLHTHRFFQVKLCPEPCMCAPWRSFLCFKHSHRYIVDSFLHANHGTPGNSTYARRKIISPKQLSEWARAMLVYVNSQKGPWLHGPKVGTSSFDCRPCSKELQKSFFVPDLGRDLCILGINVVKQFFVLVGHPKGLWLTQNKSFEKFPKLRRCQVRSHMWSKLNGALVEHENSSGNPPLEELHC